MNVLLDNKLVTKYPKIFPDTYITTDDKGNEISFAYIEVNDGWYDIIDQLCNDIQVYVDSTGVEQVIFIEVKYKYGLSIFHTGGDRNTFNMICEAGLKARMTCEMCGRSGYAKNDGTQGSGAILCDECR